MISSASCAIPSERNVRSVVRSSWRYEFAAFLFEEAGEAEIGREARTEPSRSDNSARRACVILAMRCGRVHSGARQDEENQQKKKRARKNERDGPVRAHG